jgi:endonuclease/exonuclease/phosphatase family metal-dependent hydrolase
VAVDRLRSLARRDRRRLHGHFAAPLLGGLALALIPGLTAACAARHAPVVPRGETLLAVVTWNAHDGRGDLPRLIDDLSSGRITGAPPRDYVLLLQEAVEGVEDLARRRGLSVFHVPVFAGMEPTSGTAILSTRPLEDTRTIDLPVERQHRVAAAATIAIAGERLFVVSAHLENRLDLLRGGPFGDRARGRQAEALVDALPPDGDGIVGGDMNTMLGPNEPALRVLLERFPDTPGGRSEPTFRDRLVLDHVFFDLPAGWRGVRRVVRERYGSDHHPVLGVVSASVTRTTRRDAETPRLIAKTRSRSRGASRAADQ